jgi:hypothetical protein
MSHPVPNQRMRLALRRRSMNQTDMIMGVMLKLGNLPRASHGDRGLSLSHDETGNEAAMSLSASA